MNKQKILAPKLPIIRVFSKRVKILRKKAKKHIDTLIKFCYNVLRHGEISSW